ncbi:MFS transporter [Actinomadura graeca]|uniref:MFS transporter n=1 Tax=Actinomadura graeca TaxID=2750812 RepID=A0ABX8QW23_9ACTN|nr:MFS transporter [Actinomadura graeca]QXJ22384.1 MFS transporter [Actinomadura graeca]
MDSSPTARSSTLAHAPARPVSRTWILALFLVTLGMWAGLLGAVQILLPSRIESLDPVDKVWNMAMVTALGAVAAVVSSPIAGALSDRTTSRFGRRRPWVAASTAVCAGALLALPMQTSLAGIAFCWILVHGGVNAMHAALCAAIPDRVPVDRRGMVSAIAGLAMPLGLVLGTLLVSGVPVWAGAVLLGAVVAGLAVPYVLQHDEPAHVAHGTGPHEPTERTRLRSPGRLLTGLYVSPREHPDFAWALGGRFFAQLATSLATLYLLYFLRDEVGLDDPDGGVAVLSLLYTVGAVGSAVAAGRLSDRTGRRKVFVLASTLLMAAALTFMSMAPTWPVVLVSAAVIGAGYGIYIAIDQALVTQVLPEARDHAKDLGLVNMAGSGAVAVAPLIAAQTVLHGGYSLLFTLAAGLAVVGGLSIQPIRSVR